MSKKEDNKNVLKTEEELKEWDLELKNKYTSLQSWEKELTAKEYKIKYEASEKTIERMIELATAMNKNKL
jgi:hypothetical protein